ncbi:MAG: CoA transferase, partial [Comamonadaceae bacterium]
LGIAALQTSEYFGSGKDPQKLGSAHPRNAPYQAFRCRDGYFGMAAGNNALWRSVCEIVGHPELATDERYTTTTLRAHNQTALREFLEAIFMQDDGANWLQKFRERGVPCAPINSYSEVLVDPQVQHMEWVQPIDLPNGVQTKTFGAPVRIGGVSTPIHRRPPALGEHTDEVLGALRDARASA